jgi:hypothetical protein
MGDSYFSINNNTIIKKQINMKIHLKFKESDKPDQMGLDHIIEFAIFEKFISDRLNILKNPCVTKDNSKLFFTKEDGTEGVAYLKEVNDYFNIDNI